MGIMVCSLLWVMRDLYHQPYHYKRKQGMVGAANAAVVAAVGAVVVVVLVLRVEVGVGVVAVVAVVVVVVGGAVLPAVVVVTQALVEVTEAASQTSVSFVSSGTSQE